MIHTNHEKEKTMTQNEIQYDTQIQNQKEMIKNGEHQELYHEWAMTARTDIRADLAYYGYELDTLIHDPNAAIRRLVMYNRPNYIKQRYEYEDPEDVYAAIQQLSKLDVKVLMSQLSHWRDIDENITKTLELKLKLMNYTPTELEKTMSRVQLYMADSPLWAHDLSISLTRKACALLSGNIHIETIFDAIEHDHGRDKNNTCVE